MASCYHISMSSFFLPTLYIIHYAACWSMLHARGSIPTTINIFILSWFRTLYRLYYILLLYTMYYYYYIYIYTTLSSQHSSHFWISTSISSLWRCLQLSVNCRATQNVGANVPRMWEWTRRPMGGHGWWLVVDWRGGRGLGWAIFFGLVHEEILGN